ncbi:hypothetical protein DRQ36_00470 [bacterium]|nr:MAG: hypothetical protein DRQ36_00470 [bacterium]
MRKQNTKITKKRGPGFWPLFLLPLLIAGVIAEGIPEMTGTSHILVRDVFGTAGNFGRTGASYVVHDAIGQPYPVFYPDSSLGASNELLVGFLPPDQYDNIPPQSWVWVEHRYNPDTMIIVHWLGDDYDPITGSDNGIFCYDVDYRVDGGGWLNWLVCTTDTVDTFGPGLMAHDYEFRVRATDGVGNVEPWPIDPDSFALTTIDYLINLKVPVAVGGLPLDAANYINYSHYDTSATIFSSGNTYDSAFVWCVPGSELILSLTSVGSGFSEQWITNDPTNRTIIGPGTETATYYHQFKTYLELIGTDAVHVATLEELTQFATTISGLPYFGFFDDWVDRLGTLRFSEYTAGVPPRRTYDVREWTNITTSIYDTICYGVSMVTIKNDFGVSDTGYVIVDWDTFPSPYVTYWTIGTRHVIETITPQLTTEFDRYVFNAWSDGGGIRHTVDFDGTTSEYIAYFDKQYPVTISKTPEEPYGWIAFDEDTAWGTAQETFWSYPSETHTIAVSDSDAYMDSIWTFSHWLDGISTPQRVVTIHSHVHYVAIYDESIAPYILSFDMSDTVWNIGIVNIGETRVMNDYESIVLTNTGDISLDWGLWIRTTGEHWSTGFTPGWDRFTLRARFTGSSIAPTPFEYHAVNDWVKESMIWSTTSIFGPGGSDVPPTGTNWAYSWFMFKAPTWSTYGTVSEVLRVGVLARAHMP